MYLILSGKIVLEVFNGDLRSAQHKAEKYSLENIVEVSIWTFKGKYTPEKIAHWSEAK